MSDSTVVHIVLQGADLVVLEAARRTLCSLAQLGQPITLSISTPTLPLLVVEHPCVRIVWADAGNDSIAAPDGDVRLLVSSRRSTTVLDSSSPFDALICDSELASAVILPWCKVAQFRATRMSKGSTLMFLAQGAHELRMPLGAMLSYTEHLKDPSLDYETQLNIIDTILRSGSNLLTLIDEVLTFAGLETGGLEVDAERMSLFELLEDLRPILGARSEKSGNYFQIEYAYPLPEWILSDSLRIRQVLLNLIGNAIKFTDGGAVSLIVSYAPEHRELLFDVVDTGKGIPAEFLPHMFEPFDQGGREIENQFGGSGLGLFLSKSICEALGGCISAASSAACGSTFSFKLPLSENSAGPVVSSMPSGSLVVKTTCRLQGRVLVADDAASTREFMEAVLSQAGADVVTACDGQDAVNAVLSKPFDLILMDAEMPELTGYEAMVRLRQCGVQTPIVAITAHLHRADLQRCLQAGATQSVSKTFSRDDICKIAARYVGVETDEPIISDGSGHASEGVCDNPRITRAAIKYLDRVERALPQIRLAQERCDWRLLKGLIHPLIPGKMFGFESVTDIVRDLALALRQLTLSQDEVVAKCQHLELLTTQLDTDRRRLSSLLSDGSKSELALKGGSTN